jgi:Trk K+ transport system NAD-binding subunit
MRMPGDVLVVALRRNGELIIPNGDTNLECGDHLTLMGSLQHLQDAREIFLNQ